MGLFGKTSKGEAEEIRNVKDCDLVNLNNDELLLIALARLMEGMGIDDGKLIAEMYRRGGGI